MKTLLGLRFLFVFLLFPFFPPFFFTSAHIGGNLIFHISLWFVDVSASGRRVHMQAADTLTLISSTVTNCGRRTNERNIGRFHGSRLRWAELPGAPAPALSPAAGQALGIKHPALTVTHVWRKLMQSLGFNPRTEAVTSALSTGKHNIYAPSQEKEKHLNTRAASHREVDLF